MLLALLLLVGAAPSRLPDFTNYVVDGANVIGPAEKQQLLDLSSRLDHAGTAQLAVLTVTPEMVGDDSIEDFAAETFKKWGLGHGKKKADGILIVIEPGKPGQRHTKVEVGYGLEGVLPDAIAKLIIEDAIVPQLRAGEVNAAVMAGANQIIGGLVDGGAQWKRIMQARAPASPGPRPWWQRVNWNLMLPLIIIPLFIFLRIFFPKYADPVPASGPRGSSRDWDRDRWSDSSSSSSSDSSDSFSGGGGSSGGGGASGSW